MIINLNMLRWQKEFFLTEARYKTLHKGRRLGATRGAMSDVFRELVNNRNYSILWGDVSYGNIEKYIQRYLIPICEHSKTRFAWDKIGKVFKIDKSYVDYRSAEHVDAWEGFGYKHIYINEAGIVLKNRYIWENAVSPMMFDYKDSKATIFGTPKGKMHKGEKSVFWELCTMENPLYKDFQFSSYDNELNDKEAIKAFELTMPKLVARQEIYGDFIDTQDSLIKDSMYLIYSELPENLDIYIGVDLAITNKKSSDYTAFAVIGVNGGMVYVLDIIRGKWQFHEILTNLDRICNRYKPRLVAVENVQFQAAVVQEMTRLTRWNVKGVRPDREKSVRFQPLVSRYEQGFVFHNPNLIPEFKKELLCFPNDEHDDMTDAIAYAYVASMKKSFINFGD